MSTRSTSQNDLKSDDLRDGPELGRDVVDVGHELALQLVDQVEQGMAVEADPDEGDGAALAAPGRTDIDHLQGIDGGFLAGHAIGNGLNFRKRERPNLATDIRTLLALAPRFRQVVSDQR